MTHAARRHAGNVKDLLDPSVYDGVETQLRPEDRRSLLALLSALRERIGRYAYLEIGSHLGGSLQPILLDPSCTAAMSVDPRPAVQADERGTDFAYPGNSTKAMTRGLRAVLGESAVSKLTCFERDASAVAAEELPERPRFCFIDGEHTDRAVRSDFAACLRFLPAEGGVVAFDDVHVVFRGYAACIERLRKDGTGHRAYVLPDKIGVIEVGHIELFSAPVLLERIADPGAFLALAAELGRYRDAILAIARLPGARLVQRALARTPFGAPFRPR